MPAARTRATTAPKTRTLLLEMGHGPTLDDFQRPRPNKGGKPIARRQLITIPATAKITFGTLHPGGKGYIDTNAGVYLRIYEGTTQTACFGNVLSFRDVDYPVKVQRVRAAESAGTTVQDGEVTDYSASAAVSSVWLDEDFEF